MDYRFTPEGHRHELLVDGEWKKLTGCTTILQILAKPALIQWAANQAVDFIKNSPIWRTDDVTGNLFIGNKDFEIVLNEAKSAHRKKKEEAGQKGTDVHAIIEKIIKGSIEISGGILPNVNYDDIKQVQHFLNWAKDNKVKFLESEKHLFSKDKWLAGICDFICEIDGKVWIGDIKTSSGIYPEAFFQCAGYQLLLEDMKYDKEITGHIVVNLRKDGKFDEKRSVSNEDNRSAFLAALTLYRVTEKVKGQIIN